MKEARLGKTLTWCHLASGIKNDLANFSISAATTNQPSRFPYSFCTKPLADECAAIAKCHGTATPRAHRFGWGELIRMRHGPTANGTKKCTESGVERGGGYPLEARVTRQ